MKEREKIDLKTLGGEKKNKMRNENRVKFGKRKALLFVALFAVLVSLSMGTASAATHYVHTGESIQDAIDAANASDTIVVYSGTYYETVNVSKQLVLRGVDTGEGKPIVDAGRDGSAIILSADGIVLEGFEVTNSTGRLGRGAGIRIISENNSVRDINATNSDYGIVLYFSSNNTLKLIFPHPINRSSYDIFKYPSLLMDK